MEITEEDIKAIASLHISPRISDAGIKRPASLYRFYLDKIKLFHRFDRESIIVSRSDSGAIAGVLVYTYDEQKFNRFSGPSSPRFYLRALKAAIGLYGINFSKLFLAAKSMLGKNTTDVPAQPDTQPFGKIWVLIIAEEVRRKGIAMTLLQKCSEAMKNRGGKILRVTVKTDNSPAIKAYEKSRFKIVGTCTESSGDSYVMQTTL
ncbi:MAG: GNAT family N-acetyltransferase [Victivallales bacterium]|nr:GNAT family N-acetyltransferase [Victivallales bacterium]